MTDAPSSVSPGVGPVQALAGRYGKTEAGRAEIRERALPLSRPRLGLVRGTRLVREAGRCSDPAEIRALALRFVELVRAELGDPAGQALAQVLIAPE